MRKPIVAILYDFDSTLAVSDMQNFGFIPALGMTPEQFWAECTQFSEKEGVERTLSYLYTMIRLSKEKGVKMTREWLNEMGRGIRFFPGVETWFERINEYGKQHGVRVEHYLVSSGNKEIVEGTPIYKKFKMAYACEFLYDPETKEPMWPKLAINYTQKTQYFFRIAKGVTDAYDDERLNAKSAKKRIPYQNIVYIGDGMTDVPSMIIAKNNGGKSIAVYPAGKKSRVLPLYEGGRVNYIATADYRENRELEKVMHLIIQSLKIASELGQRENQNALID